MTTPSPPPWRGRAGRRCAGGWPIGPSRYDGSWPRSATLKANCAAPCPRTARPAWARRWRAPSRPSATWFDGVTSASSAPSLKLPNREAIESALDPRVAALLNSGDEAVVSTLETYLDLAGDAKATAELLHLHRGTLYYRLDKAQRLAGIDVHNGYDRLAVHLGLKLAKLGPEAAGASSAAFGGAGHHSRDQRVHA